MKKSLWVKLLSAAIAFLNTAFLQMNEEPYVPSPNEFQDLLRYVHEKRRCIEFNEMSVPERFGEKRLFFINTWLNILWVNFSPKHHDALSKALFKGVNYYFKHRTCQTKEQVLDDAYRLFRQELSKNVAFGLGKG